MPEAKVYVLTRPLEDEGRALRHFGDGGKHWALVVEFLDGSGVYLCELTSNGEGVDARVASRYISNSASGHPDKRCVRFNRLNDCKEGNIEAEIKLKGMCYTTVDFLRFHTRNILRGQQYHLLASNCQKFVEKFIELLEVTNLPDSCSMLNCNDVVAKGAAGAVGVVGIAAVVGLLVSAFSNPRNSNRN